MRVYMQIYVYIISYSPKGSNIAENRKLNKNYLLEWNLLSCVPLIEWLKLFRSLLWLLLLLLILFFFLSMYCYCDEDVNYIRRIWLNGMRQRFQLCAYFVDIYAHTTVNDFFFAHLSLVGGSMEMEKGEIFGRHFSFSFSFTLSLSSAKSK